MGELIFKGFLDKKEYYKIFFKMRKYVFILYLLIQLFYICTVVCFVASNPNISNGSFALLRMISLIFLVISLIFLFVIGYICITTGGPYPYGNVEVYKRENSLFIKWTYKNNTLSKALRMEKVAIMFEHSYVQESRKNFVFLPKELYPVLCGSSKADSNE